MKVQRVIVAVLVRALPEIDLLPLDLLVGDLRQDVLDPIQPRALLVIAVQDVPERGRTARRFEHRVPGAGVIIPARIGFDVHWTELPLTERVFDALPEAAILLLLPNFEP